jgi:hypothetical protein
VAFTASSIQEAADGYKRLFYGLKSLPAPKKEAMEKISLEAWETMKVERGIKSYKVPEKKKAKAS